MKINKPVSFVLGILLIGFGILIFLETHSWHGFIPALIGASLVYVGLRPGRTATIMFGHVLVAVGCFLVTWGLTLLPYTKPILPHILLRPLFWGLISIFGGICAICHGFCNCLQHKKKIQ